MECAGLNFVITMFLDDNGEILNDIKALSPRSKTKDKVPRPLFGFSVNATGGMYNKKRVLLGLNIEYSKDLLVVNV